MNYPLTQEQRLQALAAAAQAVGVEIPDEAWQALKRPERERNFDSYECDLLTATGVLEARLDMCPR